MNIRSIFFYILGFSVVCCSFLLFSKDAFSQLDSSGIAVSVPLEGINVQRGQLICSIGSGLGLCNQAYHSSIYGVVVTNPTAYIESQVGNNERLVLTSGVANVRVTSENGLIRKGDFITSSNTPGIGQLADKPGHVLGTALQSFGEDSAIGEVDVALNIHYTSSLPGEGLESGDEISQRTGRTILTPITSMIPSFNYLKYILAFLIAVVGLVFSFLVARRREKKSQKDSGFGKFVNLIIILAIIGSSLVFAYIILIS
jgi:hypothetical protein